MSAQVWLQEDGSVVLPCPTCEFKIHIEKKDICLDMFVCTECMSATRNPIGTVPVHIEVPEDAWEDMGADDDDDWEEISEDFLAAASEDSLAAASEDSLAATSEDFLAATSDASSSASS